MAIDAVSSVSTNGTGTQAAVNETNLGKDDFLRLLITQLQSQDPLNPMESAEFTAQLAQFGSLEQLHNVNDQLDRLHNDQTQSMKQMAVSMIGKTIKLEGNEFNFVDGKSEEMVFELGENAKDVTISIYDEGGRLVDELPLGRLSAGEHRPQWDGIGPDDKEKDSGRYSFEITAVNNQDEIINDVEKFVAGTVTGVSLQNEFPQVLMENHKVPLDKILKVSGAESFEEII